MEKKGGHEMENPEWKEREIRGMEGGERGKGEGGR